jgi:hypothetical protein
MTSRRFTHVTDAATDTGALTPDARENWIPPVSILNPRYSSPLMPSNWPSIHDHGLSCAASDYALLCSELHVRAARPTATEKRKKKKTP